MMKIIDNLRIKTTGQIIAVFLILIAIGVVVISGITIQKTNQMAVMWKDFNTGPVQKTIALSRLRGALGYGGTIHKLKNFVIHKDRQEIIKVNSALLNVTVALIAYKSFGINAVEEVALSELESVLNKYSKAIAVAERMVSEGASTVAIDNVIFINDESAIQAMEALEQELQHIRKQSSDQVYASVTAVTNLVTKEAIAITILNGVLIVVFLFFTIWRLIRPISVLGEAMKNIGEMSIRGISSMEHCLDIKGPREISELASSFNRMIDKLNVSLHYENKLQNDLRDAQKLEAVGQLAGGIAHEINTPSQYIGDNLKFLMDAHKDLFALLDKSLALTDAVRDQIAISKWVKEVDNIREEIDFEYLQEEIPSATEQSLAGISQVSRIVLAMKEFSHPGVKEKSLTNINRSLENTITISRNEWKHVAEITTTFEENLPAVSCLSGELNQVFLNLIVNAAHAISEKYDGNGLGKIGIFTQSKDGFLTVKISDDGAGIPANVKDKIFNPFFTTKDVGQGTGQGLSISRDIVVKKHGGTITFESEIGKGTAFIVQIPIIEEASTQMSLSVDDDYDNELGTKP